MRWGSKNFGEDVVLLVGVGVEALEVGPGVEALLAEEEVVAVLAHPAVLEDLALAAEALVALVLLHLRLEDDLQLVGGLVAAGEAGEGGGRTLEVALLAWVKRGVQSLKFLQEEQLKWMPMIGFW